MATDPNSDQQTEVTDPNPDAGSSTEPATESTGTSSAGTSAAPPPTEADTSETTDTTTTGDTTADTPSTDEASGVTTDTTSDTGPDVPDSALTVLPDHAGNTGGKDAVADDQASLVGDPQATAPATDQTVDGDGNSIIVPSGAAATPNSPPSTLANNGLTSASSEPQGSLDPALTDPVGTARAGAEGRSTDPAARLAENATVEDESGTLVAGDSHPDNVAPAVSEGDKPSDGGPAAYPFPVQGDIEVALLESTVYQGEKMEPIKQGDFVILGEHELVPAVLVGAQAAVLEAPTILCNCDWAPRTHEHIHPTAGITVQTRDDKNARLTVPLAAIQRILRGGRISR